MIAWIEMMFRISSRKPNHDAIHMIVWIEVTIFTSILTATDRRLIRYSLDKNCRLVYQTGAAIFVI